MLDPLLQLAKKLRKECPWDKKQTLKTIPPMLIEETQEMIEAIEKKDWENMKEEIGDVLFNLCLLMQMAEEKKYFTAQEVMDAIEEKIISRHTWVFGGDKATTAEEALKIWNKNKKAEKKLKKKT
jgi:uncharacterized protein YabN with tetrapyrrole methylase and pyrophosphatase domain